MPAVVVQRKFALPDLPEIYLTRERLLCRLGEGLDPAKRLTLLGGGAGTGKTTLLAGYLRGTPALAFWYGLTPAERDPVVFFGHLAEGLCRIVPGMSRQAAEVLGALGQGGVGQAMGLLCDELSARLDGPLVVALDDTQHLGGDAATIEGLEALVRFFPEQGQLIFSGHSWPPCKLAQYQLKGQLVALDEAELRLERREIERLLERADSTDRAPAVVDRVLERTQGWMTGVIYALAGAQGDMLQTLERPELLYDFLSEEIFAGLDVSFQRQLLLCAHLPRLDRGSCQALLGDDADGFLASVQRQRTFFTRAGDTLQFHPIFREFLQREAGVRWSSDERRELFRRLARDVAGSADEAAGCYIQAEAWDEAEARLTEAFDALLAEGRKATLLALLEGFPAAWRRDSAWLHLIEGEACRREGALARAGEILREAEGLALGREDALCRGWIAAALAAVSGAQGDAGRQAEHAQRALELLPDTALRPIAFALNVLGTAHLQRGDLSEAQTALGKAVAIYRELSDLAGEARVQHNRGLVHAHGGDLVRAISSYQDAIRLSEAAGQLPVPLTYNNLALCNLYLGRLAEAWAAAEAGMAIAERTVARRDRVYLLRTLGYLAMHVGELAQARESFESALAEATELGDRLSRANSHLGLAELASRSGDQRTAQAAIDQALECCGRALQDADMQEAASLQAELHLLGGRPDEAAELLESLSSLLAAAPNPYREFHVERLWRRWALARGDADRAATHEGRLADLQVRFGYLLADQPGQPAAAPEAMPVPALELSCLGHFSIRVDGQARSWRGGNAKVVLAYLMLNPNGATAERLREVVYPDEDATRSAIHMVVTRLRHALEPGVPKGAPSRFILFQDGRYLFNRGIHHRFDVADFRQAVRLARQGEMPAEQRRSTLYPALELYRGPFLEEFPDLTWCQLERENLRRQMREAYEEAFCLAAEGDDWVELERLAEAHLALDPASEPAFRAKMVALAMLEREEDALRVGQVARDVLRRELASDPDGETAELIALIQDRRLTVRAARSYLPARG